MANNINSNISGDLNQYKIFPFPIHRNCVTDDYNISKDVLGIGVNGKVYKCQNRHTGKLCAIKILADTIKARQEIIIQHKVCQDSEYIVKILDVYENMCQSKRSLLIIMECMEGGELFKRIENRAENPYTERDAARYISMIAKAIQHIHSKDIAHRDLKPENLLLTTANNDAIIKLSDFGFAKEGNNEEKPLKTRLFTPYYVAPEILSDGRYDKACDIWSLGVIIYILLCGYPPFFSENNLDMSPAMEQRIKAGEYRFPDDPWKNISSNARNIIENMLVVDPAQRITIDDVLQSSFINQLTSDRPIDMISLHDNETRQQLEVAVSSANEAQRRPDDDEMNIELAGPEASRIGQRKNKKPKT